MDLGEGALRSRYLVCFISKIDVMLMSVNDRSFIERTAMARRSHGASTRQWIGSNKRVDTGRQSIVALQI
jgi:hypothetical protein